MTPRGVAAVAAGAMLLAACGRDDASAPQATTAGGDPTKGRQVYLAQCVACHNSDPAKDGPLGPAVKGSAKELVEARVLRGEYPPDYKPKRDSKVMPARPDLAPSIPDIVAFLR